MICKKCGANLAPTAKFCAKCGAPVAMQPPQPTRVPPHVPSAPQRQIPVRQPEISHFTGNPVTPPRKKKSRVLPAVCVSLIVLILGAVGVLSWLDIIPVRSMGGSAEDGTAGQNLEWLINGDTLVISGNGKMWNWTEDQETPWFKLRDSIHHVLVKPGVTTVGKYAFVGLGDLNSLVLPDTITEIEDSTFQNTDPPKKIYYEGSEEDWEEIDMPEDFPEIKPSCDTVMDDKAAYQVYLDAAEALLASGAWSESMDTDIWLTAADSDEGTLTTSVDYSVQINGYQRDDLSNTTVSGHARICLSGDKTIEDVTEFTFDGDNTELRYRYTQPFESEITSSAPDDAGILDSFFSTVNQLGQDETTYTVQSGNMVQFGINVETMKQLIGETVGQEQNVKMNFENCACTAEAEIAANGTLASLRMEFPLTMTVDGEEYTGDYSVYLWFGEYEGEDEPVEDAAPEQGPAPVPTTEPQESGLVDYAGTWEFDSQTTYSLTGKSGMDIFGSSVKYGTELTIDENGNMEYHYPLGGHYKGTCQMEDGVIYYSAVCDPENAGQSERLEESGYLNPSIISEETYLEMKYFDDISIYWKRTDH